MDGDAKVRSATAATTVEGGGMPAAAPARAAAPANGADLASPAGRIEALGVTRIVLLPRNTSVHFIARWFGAPVYGQFEGIGGLVEIPAGDVSRASVSVEVATESVHTGIRLRDRHLRRAIFLDAEQYPVIAFRGGSVMRWPSHLSLPGSLTVRGVTRTEELRVSLGNATRRGVDDEPAIRLLGETTVRRSDYRLGVPSGWRRFSPLFAAIGDAVEIRVEVRVD